jgi:hypothetical protein
MMVVKRERGFGRSGNLPSRYIYTVTSEVV